MGASVQRLIAARLNKPFDFTTRLREVRGKPPVSQVQPDKVFHFVTSTSRVASPPRIRDVVVRISEPRSASPSTGHDDGCTCAFGGADRGDGDARAALGVALPGGGAGGRLHRGRG